jgi:hypothetical protein
MSIVHSQARLIDEILSECEEDFVGLWTLVRLVRDCGERDTKQYVLSLIRFLLDTDAVKAGWPDSQGQTFVDWQLSPAATVERIDREWSQLGRDPTIGEIVWFASM